MSIMRRVAPSIAIVLALAVALPAAAQDQPRPRDTVVIKSPPPTAPPPPAAKPATPPLGQPVLRKPLRNPLVAIRSGQTPAPRPVTTLVVAQSDVKAAVTPLKGLNGPSVSAIAAQCRTQCAQARYSCTAHDAGDCDTIWGQCVVTCSGANYTDTPDLAFSAGYRPGP
jgi:hypothetical protein